MTSTKIDTREIKISIKTNFPDGTNLLVDVNRTHFLKGIDEKYSGDIYSKNISVINGKIETIVYIEDSNWYNEHIRLVKALPDDIKPIAKISDDITISVLFSPKRDQLDSILIVTGIDGEYVSGNGTEIKYGFTTFRVSKDIVIPFQK